MIINMNINNIYKIQITTKKIFINNKQMKTKFLLKDPLIYYTKMLYRNFKYIRQIQEKKRESL